VAHQLAAVISSILLLLFLLPFSGVAWLDFLQEEEKIKIKIKIIIIIN